MFSNVHLAPPVELFQLGRDFLADENKNKISLGIGAYRTEEGTPWVLPVVKKAERILAEKIEKDFLDHEYVPFLGMDLYTSAATALLLGDQCPALTEGRAFGVQSVSGTGAIKIAAEFLKNALGLRTVYYSDPSWPNHEHIFLGSGWEDRRQYRYWKKSTKDLDWSGMMEDLSSAPHKSVIVLQACAHNPTGLDLNQAQWEKVADVCQERQLFPLFDCAYQGFATGCLDTDAWAVRYFVSRGFELFCAQSFSKNFGLYNERTGNLTVVMKDKGNFDNFVSQMNPIIRGMYVNPPCHGAMIVQTVLSNPELFEEWKKSIQAMSARIIDIRARLRKRIEDLDTPGDWSHITSQIGMFSYTGLTEEMCLFLQKKKHIYLMKSGRISLCGVNSRNIDYLANAIYEAITRFV